MLRRLLLAAILVTLAVAGVRLWRRLKALSPPAVPGEWRALAAQDPVLAEGLDLRDRLDRLARRAAPGQRLSLLREVHASLEALAGLAQVRLDLRDYVGRTAGVEAELGARAASLTRAAEAARDGLRAVYAELLQTFEAKGDGGAIAVGHTRSILEDLRQQAAAEGELRRWLADRAGE